MKNAMGLGLLLLLILGVSSCVSSIGISVNQNENLLRQPAGNNCSPGLAVLNESMPKAEGPVGEFTLASEVRIISDAKCEQLKGKPLTIAGLKENEIAITIDDGPGAKTIDMGDGKKRIMNDVVLDVLRRHGVKATFFVTGSNAKKHPELIENILMQGHSIANHTWDHPHMLKTLEKYSAEAAEEQIDSTNKILEEIVSQINSKNGTHFKVQPFFRFPMGAGVNDARLQGMLLKRNMANFFWAMTTKDSDTQDRDVAYNTAISMIDCYNNGIFLMHETHPAGVRSLEHFLKVLDERHYKTVYFQGDDSQ